MQVQPVVIRRSGSAVAPAAHGALQLGEHTTRLPKCASACSSAGLRARCFHSLGAAEKLDYRTLVRAVTLSPVQAPRAATSMIRI